MATHRVHFVATASAYIDVEADSPEDAIEKAYDLAGDLPGLITDNEFDLGEWEVQADVQWPDNSVPREQRLEEGVDLLD